MNTNKGQLPTPKSDKKQYQLYQQAMLEHHKAPIGFEIAIESTHHADGYNAACGDEIFMEAFINGNQVQQIGFHGDSCAICRASASMACENLPGVTIDEAKLLSQQIVAALTDDVTFIGELATQFSPLMSVQKFPVRKQCALLPWQTALTLLSGDDKV